MPPAMSATEMPGLGRRVRAAGDRQQPGLALDQQVVGAAVAHRPVRGVPGDVADDELRVPGPQGRRRQPHPVRRPGRQVLHEHVGPADQRGQRGPARGRLEVKRDRLLAPVEPDEVAGQALDGAVVGAGEVAAARALDLDDPRAEVGQLAGGVRGRDRLLERHDRDAVEGEARRPGTGSCHPARSAEHERVAGARRSARSTPPCLCRYSCSPSVPFSRPNPDAFTPPNGIAKFSVR